MPGASGSGNEAYVYTIAVSKIFSPPKVTNSIHKLYIVCSRDFFSNMPHATLSPSLLSSVYGIVYS